MPKENRSITLNVKTDIVDWLDEKAIEEELSRSDIIRRILKEAKEKEEKE